MAATVDTVERGTWTGVPLPMRAALWEVTATGAPRVDQSLPKAASWIGGPGVTNGGDFVVAGAPDGRLYRLFEFDKAPADDELPFISAITGSGLPRRGRQKSLHQDCLDPRHRRRNCILAGGATSVWSGRAMSGARRILMTDNPPQQYELLVKVASLCAADYQALPSGQQAAVCSKLLKDNRVPDIDKSTNRFAWANADSAVSALDDQGMPGQPSQHWLQHDLAVGGGARSGADLECQLF